MTEASGSREAPAGVGLLARASAAYRADFVVTRVPLLSIETFLTWANGARASGGVDASDEVLERALAEDRALLRARLCDLIGEPLISRALTVASPDLTQGIRLWRANPASRRGRSAERSLVRYLTRMASRPSPFGLVSGYHVGDIASDPAFEIDSRDAIRIVARLDPGLLDRIVRDAVSGALESEDLLLRRNPGLYRLADQIRFAARPAADIKHRLVAVRSTPSIEAVMEAADHGVRAGALLTVLGQRGGSRDDPRALLARLLAKELLIPVAQVTVTGEEPAVQAVAALRSVPGGERAAHVVGHAVGALEQTHDLAATAEIVATEIERLDVPVNRRRVLQIDSIRTGKIAVPPVVVEEMLRATELLTRIMPSRQGPLLPSFCKRFEQRFGTRWVPLLEALDPDAGVGLDALPLDTDDPTRADARRATLLALIQHGLSRGGAIELNEHAVNALSEQDAMTLPGAFAVTFKLLARDAATVERGDFTLTAPQINGPSGAQLMGRMCHGDQALEDRVRRHLEHEADTEPNAVIAEICAAPGTDWGLNLTHRPVLREWEIELGGYSGASPGQRLEPSDLLVGVVDGKVVVRSATLGCRVLFRSTSALTFNWVSLPAARLLALLTVEGRASGLEWSWGDLGDAPMLPRVSHRRTILALRRWNLSAAELRDAKPGSDAAGFRRLQRWRRTHDVPRFVTLDHPKSPILIDFDNVLSVDAFLAATDGLDPIRFVEAPEVDHGPVHGPDGRYAHEFIVPCTRVVAAGLTHGPPTGSLRLPERSRRFEPGSEWLFAGLYGPPSLADRVLTNLLGPLRDRLRAASLIDRWFFTRYRDPDHHLRVRFHGLPDQLLREVLPALHEVIAPAIDAGLIYRVTFDTYEREAERYGGLEGVELMEAASEADSDAVLAVLGQSMSPPQRRHLAVASLAAMYAQSGLGIVERHQCCDSLRRTFSSGHRSSLGTLLAADQRAERSDLEAAVSSLDDPSAPPTVQAFRDRSEALRPVLARFRELHETGRLGRPLTDVLCSLGHMFVNRLLREAGDRDELRVHDALARLYESQLARERARRSGLGTVNL